MKMYMKMGIEMKIEMTMLAMVFLVLLLFLSGKRADARSLTRRTSRRPLPHLAQPHAPLQSRRSSSRRWGQLGPLRPAGM
jgi:hypothetical protein